MIWIESFYIYKEEKQQQSFSGEEHFNKVYLTGFITSRPKIESYEGGKVIFEIAINGHSVLFWTQNFGLNLNMNKLWEELNKMGTRIKVHGNHIEVGNTKFEGITCSWEISEVKEEFLIHYVPKGKT